MKLSDAEIIVNKWFTSSVPGERSALLYRPDANETDFLERAESYRPMKARVTMDGCGNAPHTRDCQVVISGGDVKSMWLRPTPAGLRIDWRGSYVVNPMTMAAFRAEMPTKPSTWRVNAKLATYFNYEFMGKEADYYSFRVRELGGGPQAEVHAYAKKDSEAGAAAFKALRDGEEHNVTISIAYPATRKSNGITKLEAYFGDDFRQTNAEIESR